jgi:hypothetical protein
MPVAMKAGQRAAGLLGGIADEGKDWISTRNQWTGLRQPGETNSWRLSVRDSEIPPPRNTCRYQHRDGRISRQSQDGTIRPRGSGDDRGIFKVVWIPDATSLRCAGGLSTRTPCGHPMIPGGNSRCVCGSSAECVHSPQRAALLRKPRTGTTKSRQSLCRMPLQKARVRDGPRLVCSKPTSPSLGQVRRTSGAVGTAQSNGMTPKKPVNLANSLLTRQPRTTIPQGDHRPLAIAAKGTSTDDQHPNSQATRFPPASQVPHPPVRP